MTLFYIEDDLLCAKYVHFLCLILQSLLNLRSEIDVYEKNTYKLAYVQCMGKRSISVVNRGMFFVYLLN